MADNKVNFDYSQFGFLAVKQGTAKTDNWEYRQWEIRLPLIQPKKQLAFFQTFEFMRENNRVEEFLENENLRNVGWLSFEYKIGMGLIGKTPTIKDLLYCLLEDYQGETFSDWCNNFGYDNDSIKALKIYTECQENYNKLCQCIPLSLHAVIRDDLQDY